MPNNFASLFSGLSTNLNTPKFKFLQNYGTSQPTPTGPMSTLPSTPKQSVIPSNTGATATTPTKPAALSTPAAQKYVASQLPTNTSPNQTVPAGVGTPGYTYVNGLLTSVGGQATGQSSNTPQTTAPTGNVTTPSGAVIDSTTGTTVSNPPVDPKSSYTDAFTTYLSSLNPTNDETAATKKYNDDTLQAKKDQETALNSGETLGFASGEAARVAHNNSFTLDADANTLNALTAKRTATTDAQKARLDFEKSLLPSEDSFNLSPGQTRYDASGNVIATANDKPQSISDQYGTGAIGEYNFAKSQGYTGSFTDYQNEDANRKAKAVAQPKALTETQSKAQAYGDINQLLGMANSKGIPYIDSDGYFTPEGFKEIVQNAAEDGLSREDIIKQYADKIYEPTSSKLGLTAKERALLTE